jgi:hypothetical protein
MVRWILGGCRVRNFDDAGIDAHHGLGVGFLAPSSFFGCCIRVEARRQSIM